MTTSGDIQSSINLAAKELADAFNKQKAARDGLKELKKALKEKLDMDPSYTELSEKEKKLKQARKEISDELAEIKKTKEQISMETDEQTEIDDFMDQQEEKFIAVKDKVIVQLSRDLVDYGLTAEIHYKSGQLILIVARA